MDSPYHIHITPCHDATYVRSISGKTLRVIPNLQVKLIWAVKSTCNQKGYKIPLCRPGHQ